MSRKGQAIKRDVQPDPIYNSKIVTKLINNIMLDGKKGKAQKIVYGAFDLVEQKTKEKGIDVFTKALDNVKPLVELKSRRLGGANYQVPVDVTEERRQVLGLRWLVLYSRKRKEKTTIEKLAGEIIDASNNSGESIKKREATHKMAEANRAFANLRW
ncbi:MAG: 30S ribosomal protein S7 [Mycoplasmataceae bacterium]|nr:30S ribosomal protein S7 [Mycoplasmataceae bacterium]